MEYKTFKHLISIEDENNFFSELKLLNNDTNNYESYVNKFISLNYGNEESQLPNTLFKYIDFEGGIQSLENSNVQFSHPLSFRTTPLAGLKDLTEFSADRFYYDKETLLEFKSEFDLTYPEFKLEFPAEYFHVLVYQYYMNTVERNKILCLSSSNNNSHLWDTFYNGICIEYHSDLFSNKHNFLVEKNQKTFTIIVNKVIYVDKIAKLPCRISEYDWISNLIFVKSKELYENEDEYRILYTEDFMDNYNRENRGSKVNTLKKRIENTDYDNLTNKRLSFNKKFIKNVYYKSTIKDEDQLISNLDRLGINYTKIE